MVQKRLRDSLGLVALLLFAFIACDNSQPQSDVSEDEQKFSNCLDRVQRSTEKWNKALESAYVKRDPHAKKIAESDKSIFLRGSPDKGAVLLMHGILSSPHAMRLLAEEFNRKGMTVLAPLVAGFASSVKVANASSVEAWQMSIDYHARSLSPCFESFALVGFSLGGALSSDFILNRYPKLYEEKKVSRISSLLLLSPAIRPAESFVLLKANATLFVTDAVPFWLISKLKNDPDIDEMMKEPEKYNQHFPVYVGKALYKLSKILEKSRSRFDLHPLPVSLDYSQADSATDWEETRSFLTDSFFDVRVFSYSKNANVPHTLYLGHDNPIGKEIREGLARFVLRYAN